MIYRAKYLHTGWVPSEMRLPGWYWTTSNKGWTNNTLGYEWLTKSFEPSTNRGRPRLLILDGHASHLTADFIEFCINKDIELLVLPPHTSHLLQPLDVAVFAPLKTALHQETDMIVRAGGGSGISKKEWARCYVAAREKAIITPNVEAGFRGAGISPYNRGKILMSNALGEDPFRTPSPEPEETSFNSALLNSSPPSATDLHQSNSALKDHIKYSDMDPTAKRYTERLINLSERQAADRVILEQSIKEKDKLLASRKGGHKLGARVAHKGVYVYSTPEILESQRQYEARSAAKKLPKPAVTKAKKPARPAQIPAVASTAPANSMYINWQLEPTQ